MLLFGDPFAHDAQQRLHVGGGVGRQRYRATDQPHAARNFGDGDLGRFQFVLFARAQQNQQVGFEQPADLRPLVDRFGTEEKLQLLLGEHAVDLVAVDPRQPFFFEEFGFEKRAERQAVEIDERHDRLRRLGCPFRLRLHFVLGNADADEQQQKKPAREKTSDGPRLPRDAALHDNPSLCDSRNR
ncbi:MAG: hypothetical protein WEB58_01485 [Planctomycetaceae bacterium]